jgi:hypothetical protein
MEEYPDELRTKTPADQPGTSQLGDFLREAASWDPDVEQLVGEAVQEGSERELVTAGRRLLDERRLTEQSLVARLVRLLADAGGLGPGQFPDDGGGPAGPPPDPDPGARPDPEAGPLGAGLPLLGRETELAVASRLRDRWPDGVSVVSVTGPAGAGKTRFSRRLAASLDGSQPGRRLRVSLSRAAPGAADRRIAAAPYEALAELLTQLGVPAAEIPATLEARRARYAAELAGQYHVILLDDVVHEDQVPSLLPPQRGFVVVTSRAPLTGLNDASALFVRLERLAGDWPRRLVRRVFQAHGIEPDDAAVAAIARWSDGLPGPAILLARWAAVTARAKGLAPGVVAGWLEAAASADPAAAVIGLLSPGQEAVLRSLAALRLPQADQQALSLSTGLGQDEVAAALAGLAELGLVGEGECDGTWVIDPFAADRAQARASAAGQLAGASYEQLAGPVIGLYALRARALLDLMTQAASEAGAAVRAWALRQWQAERAGLAAALEAAAAAPRPALARALAAAFMDGEAAAGAASGGYEGEAAVTAVALIARDAGDQQLEARALAWLEDQDRIRGTAVPEPARVVAEPPPEFPLPPDALPVERAVAAELNAVPDTPVLFGARDRWS